MAFFYQSNSPLKPWWFNHLNPFSNKAFLLSFFMLLQAVQMQAQTLRGVIRDADNGDAITGATVVLQFSRGEAAPISLATNPSGEFLFEKVRAGYYSMSVSVRGYESQVLSEVYITSGKEQVLDLALQRSNTPLAEVTILSAKPGRRALLPLGEIPLTRDQTQRFPAMFFDPARLATAYPGVSQVDDGTNILSIRGNSPSSVRWRLEGVDIVNPNHLPNAGTFSDRPAAASGGILMFSAQLLDNSSLLTGAMPAGYGDALGGVMDMYLRKGNNHQHEFTAQAGLVGLDLAAEGPLGSKGKNSYLANYRYSTVGLLGQLGVSFGDEQINFQDLSFNVRLEGKGGGYWSLFGLGGLSENIFKHKTDTAEIKAYKDFFNIDFYSKTGVLGLSNWTPIGKKGWLKTAIALSGQSNTRDADSDTYLEWSGSDDFTESKISASITYSQRMNHRIRLQTGIIGDYNQFEFKRTINGLSFVPVDESYYLLQPYAQLNWQSPNQKNSTTLGVNGVVHNGVIFSYAIEPRFSFTRKLAAHHRISLAAGGYSQSPAVWLFRYLDDLIRSYKIEAGYAWNFAANWQFKTAVYRQWITNSIYFTDEKFSLVNNSEQRFDVLFRPSYNVAQGNNSGVELTVERNLQNGWFLLSNASFFDSKFSKVSSPSAQDWLPSRWNIGHLVNVTFGKEWQREKAVGKERTIGLNARINWAGSAREADINLAESQATHSTVYDETAGYTHTYPDYFRLDFRVYWRKYLGNRRNSTFALDLQNLTGQQNLAYHYYDPYTNKIENKYQLGTIPNFSWRLEF